MKNFIASNRRWTVVKRHAPMILKPLVAALLSVGVWHLLRHCGIHFSAKSEIPVTAAVIPTIAIVYGVFAALVLAGVWEEYKTISFAVVQKDRIKFLIHRDEQIPIMIHLLLGTLAITLITLVMLLHYEDIWAGRVSVFAISFTLVLLGVVAVELDNPLHSVWFHKKVPTTWLTADLEEEFKIKEEN